MDHLESLKQVLRADFAGIDFEGYRKFLYHDLGKETTRDVLRRFVEISR